MPAGLSAGGKKAWLEQQARLLQVRHDRAMARPPAVEQDTFNASQARAGPIHEAFDPCQHTHKAAPGCDASAGTLPLLVTGVGRSGTHHTESVLRKMGVKVHHEAAREDGSVSWIYAVVDDRAFYPWEAAKFRIAGRRFQRIFHQVQRPQRGLAGQRRAQALSDCRCATPCA
jgi:hypothetical protein